MTFTVTDERIETGGLALSAIQGEPSEPAIIEDPLTSWGRRWAFAFFRLIGPAMVQVAHCSPMAVTLIASLAL